jgi:hypothetical protein
MVPSENIDTLFFLAYTIVVFYSTKILLPSSMILLKRISWCTICLLYYNHILPGEHTTVFSMVPYENIVTSLFIAYTTALFYKKKYYCLLLWYLRKNIINPCRSPILLSSLTWENIYTFFYGNHRKYSYSIVHCHTTTLFYPRKILLPFSMVPFKNIVNPLSIYYRHLLLE